VEINMKFRLIGRIQTWTLATAVLVGLGATSFGNAQDVPDKADDNKSEQVDLATQQAAKVNAAMLAARRFEREGKWREAANKYSEVMQLMPRNEQASRGYGQAMAMLDEGKMLQGPTSSGVASVQQRYQEQRDRA